MGGGVLHLHHPAPQSSKKPTPRGKKEGRVVDIITTLVLEMGAPVL